MYPLHIKDNAFYVGNRCLGDILEVMIVSAGCVNGNIAQYTAKLDDNVEVTLNVPVNTPTDHYLGQTMLRKIWIWCFENKLNVKVSKYGQTSRA